MSEQPIWDTDLKRFGYAPGSYFCRCGDCEQEHTADKRARRCEPCARKAREEENAFLAARRDEIAKGKLPMDSAIVTPLPCPFCGVNPALYPKRPEVEGNAFGIVRCENADCPAQPAVSDGEMIADERGSDAYKKAAIVRWNRRFP